MRKIDPTSSFLKNQRLTKQSKAKESKRASTVHIELFVSKMKALFYAVPSRKLITTIINNC